MGRSLSLRLVSGMIAAGLVAASALPATAQEGDDWAAGVSGPAVLSGWQSSPSEGNALTQTLLGFQAKYPNIPVDYQPVAGDYPALMAAKFASGEVPDVFYVNADYAQEWIDQGLLLPLDDYIEQAGIDTSAFFPGYAEVFQKDGVLVRLPQGRQHHRDGLQQRPRDGPAHDDGRARERGRGSGRDRRANSAPVPQPGPRSGSGLPLRQRRRAPLRGRHGRAPSTPRPRWPRCSGTSTSSPTAWR